MIGQRLTAPVFGNVTKHAVFDFVPFAGAGWEVTIVKHISHYRP